MADKLNDMMTGIYGFSVRDNKVVPPKHHFPKAVAERADYFWEMAEDGLTLMGGMECIFADDKPEGFDFWATKEWLPKTEEFDEWVGHLLSLAQSEMMIYLLFGNSGDQNE
ncbi:hypothetical protein [Streptococcus pyogenes]|uniref:hypothetical protein n=1 Tax=Streptococcus pyogenes TaxID=1314 RepID=UPI000E025028|nr:hypothetical protein [Streptococcus pyogenes]SUO50671.1 gp24 [Streptococcus pyogenes]HEP1278711.1 hypothetical protein [Streptococcus pyogenes]